MSKDTSKSCSQKETQREGLVLPTLIDQNSAKLVVDKVAKLEVPIACGSKIGSASNSVALGGATKDVDNVGVKFEASVPAKKIRKPCYGWISDDDSDDEENFIMLPPMKENDNFRGV